MPPKLFLIILSRVSSLDKSTTTLVVSSPLPPLGTYMYLTVSCGVVITVAAWVCSSSLSFMASSPEISVCGAALLALTPMSCVVSSVVVSNCSSRPYSGVWPCSSITLWLVCGVVVFVSVFAQLVVLSAIRAAVSASCALFKMEYFFFLFSLFPKFIVSWPLLAFNGLACAENVLFLSLVCAPSTFALILKSVILSPEISLQFLYYYKTSENKFCENVLN